MLMDRGCAVQPIIGVYVESRPSIKSDWWITEPRIDVVLSWKLWRVVHPADYVQKVNQSAWVSFDERFSAYVRKYFFIVIVVSPALLDQRTQSFEELHLTSSKAGLVGTILGSTVSGLSFAHLHPSTDHRASRKRFRQARHKLCSASDAFPDLKGQSWKLVKWPSDVHSSLDRVRPAGSKVAQDA